MADVAELSSTDLAATRVHGFLDELKAAGFNIGVDQYIQASKLIIWMSQEANTDSLLEDRMKAMLSSLVCKTEDQQRRFPKLFSNWVQRQTEPSMPSEDAVLLSGETKAIVKRRSIRWITAGAAAVLISILAVNDFLRKPQSVTASTQTSTPNNQSPSTEGLDDIFGVPSSTESAGGQPDSVDYVEPTPKTHIPPIQPESSQGPDSTVKKTNEELSNDGTQNSTQNSSPIEPDDLANDDAPIAPNEKSNSLPRTTDPLEKLTTQFDWEPLANKQPNWNRPAQPWLPVLLWFFPALASLLWLLSDWIAFAFTAKFLTRKRVSQNQAITTSELSAGRDPHGTLFNSIDFARIAQIFRRHDAITCDTLDVDATAVATAENIGIFSPVMMRRRQTPSYLALVGRNSQDDHQSAIAEEYLQLLQENGVDCHRYFFYDDARFCYKADASSHRRLSELGSIHANDRLLVLANSETLIDPVNGGLVSWAKEFDPWEEPAFFAFPGNEDRMAFKRSLSDRFLVVPALPAGFDAVADRYLALAPLSDASVEGRINNKIYPLLLQHDPYRWQEDYAPEREECDQLIKQLNAYLGTDGFRWLCACAVYPEITWRITVYLGQAIEQHRKIVLCETSLHALARLPWFRTGSMPNWLRVELLTRLDKKDQRFVRKVLTEFLISGATESEAKSVRVSDWSDSFSKRVLRQVYSSWQRRTNEAVGTRDVVFRSFLFSPLALRLPSELTRKLMAAPVRFSVTRVIAFSLGCLIAAVGMIFYNPYASYSLADAIPYQDKQGNSVKTNDVPPPDKDTLPPGWPDNWGPTNTGSQWIGSTGCATTACHGNSNDPTASWQNSALTWLSRDPHSGAGDSLRSEESRQILTALSPVLKTEGEVDAFLRKRCISCHLSATAEDVASTLPLEAGRVREGVSCESCHGPARPWLENHKLASWTGNERFDSQAGMRNTESLIDRTEGCMRCHVGSRTADGIVRDVNHDLIAAGHPAFRFDMLSYQDNMPHHWNDDNAVEAEFSRTPLKTHLVGNSLGLAIAARLSSERAKQSLINATNASEEVPWPELSEFNCSACHQDLTARAYRLPKKEDGKPSIQISDALPLWNAWYTASIAGNGDTNLWKFWPKAGAQSSWIDSAESWTEFSLLQAKSYADSHSGKSALSTITVASSMLNKRAPSDWNEAVSTYRVFTASARELMLQVDTAEIGRQLAKVLKEQIEPQLLAPPGLVEPENFDPREFRDVAIKAFEGVLLRPITDEPMSSPRTFSGPPGSFSKSTETFSESPTMIGD